MLSSLIETIAPERPHPFDTRDGVTAVTVVPVVTVVTAVGVLVVVPLVRTLQTVVMRPPGFESGRCA